jgi:HK97 family phage portal protein
VGARFQNLFNKYIWNVSKKDVGSTFDLKGTDAWERIFGSFDNFSEETVTERRVFGLATAYTCLNALSRTHSALPCGVFEETKDGKKNAITDHAAYWLLSQEPNSYMSAANMAHTSELHLQAYGNSVIGINRYARTNEPKSLDIIQPGDWDCVMHDGDLWYKIRGEMYHCSDVLHYRQHSMDGIMGISPIRQNQILFGQAFKQARYQGMTLGDRPPGFLHYEGNLSPEQRAQNQKSWKEDRQGGKTAILTGKWGYTPIILPPGEAEYISIEGMTDQKIYGIFNVPPTFAQNWERATWSNSENADLFFAKHTITPVCVLREKENNMKLFTKKEKATMFTKYNLNGLLRGDIAARAAFYTAMRNVAGMNGNEIRSLEDMNAYEGGDIFTIQSANIPMDQLRKHYESIAAKVGEQGQEKPRNGQKVNGHIYEN